MFKRALRHIYMTRFFYWESYFVVLAVARKPVIDVGKEAGDGYFWMRAIQKRHI